MDTSALPTDIADRASQFQGRGWVLDEVRNWIEHGQERFLILSGEPGAGKTALAAWLVGAGPAPDDDARRAALDQVRKAWSAVHFCIASNQGGSVNPIRFAQSLGHQLGDRLDGFAEAAINRLAPEVNIHQEARENWGTMIGAKIGTLIITSNAQDVYNRAIREPLETVLAAHPERKVFILVDALDEALRVPHPTIVTLLAGSNDFPPGVHFLVTTRNDARVLDQLARSPRRQVNLSASSRAEVVDADVRAFVKARLADADLQARLGGAGSDTAVDALVDWAAGNFLYITFLLREIAEGRRPLGDFEGLPRGLFALYREYLDALLTESGADRWANGYQPLLGRLSVASPAAPDVPDDILSRWTNVPDVYALLTNVAQLTEHVPGEESGTTLHHRSMVEFLNHLRYSDDPGSDGPPVINRYYTPSREQHNRIATYYLTNYGGAWEECEPYGLRQLAGHLLARIDPTQPPAKRREQTDAYFSLVLDASFRKAQREKLGDIHATLLDLRAAIDVALVNDDVVRIGACAGAYRETLRVKGILPSIVDAVGDGDFNRAMQRANHYVAAGRTGQRWLEVLFLYLAWGAAEAGKIDAAREIVERTERVTRTGHHGMADALLARTARAVEGATGGATPAATVIAEWARETHPIEFLITFDEARARATAPRVTVTEELRHTLMLVNEAAADNPEATEVWRQQLQSAGMHGHLLEIVGDPGIRHLIGGALQAIIEDPYERYRDIGLDVLGAAVLASPDTEWMRWVVQAIFAAGLDHEGVYTALDLPAILLVEADARALPVPGNLRDYVLQPMGSADQWCSSLRGHSANAAARFARGETDAAWGELLEASRQPRGYSGYTTMALLSLANRCREFGDPDRARQPIWGFNGDVSLIAGARDQASYILDDAFQSDAADLIDLYETWLDGPAPAVEEATRTLAGLTMAEDRRVYIDYVSAAWRSAGTLDAAALRTLLLPSLGDGAALDALLGRFVGQRVGGLSDAELTSVMAVCETSLIEPHPWPWERARRTAAG